MPANSAGFSLHMLLRCMLLRLFSFFFIDYAIDIHLRFISHFHFSSFDVIYFVFFHDYFSSRCRYFRCHTLFSISSPLNIIYADICCC